MLYLNGLKEVWEDTSRHLVFAERARAAKLRGLPQHRDGVGDATHDREVVGDEEVGEAELALELLEQLDEDEASSQDIEQILAGLEDMESAGAGFGPSSFTLVLAPGGPSADELSMAFAMNLENGAPLMRFGLEYLGLAGSTEHERDGKVAYEFDGGEATIKTSTTVNGIQTSEEIQLAEELDVSFFVGFVHDTAIFSDSKELLLDTLVATDFEETPGAPPASPLRRELADLRSDWLLAAAMVDHPLLDPADVLAADLLDTDLDLGWTEVPFGAARLGIGVDGRDLNLRIEVDGLDPGDVGQVAAGFEELAASQNTETFTTPAARRAQRRFFRNTIGFTLDGSGRFVVPERFREHAGLEAPCEVTMLGVSKRGEIWNGERLAAFEEGDEDFDDLGGGFGPVPGDGDQPGSGA